MHQKLSRLLRSSLFSLTVLGSVVFFTQQVSAATYYMDSANGNDSNAGTSESLAWKNLSKLHGRNFVAGDVIVFKRGGTWTGPLVINDSGTQAAPIRYGAYGSGAKPIITGLTSNQYKRAVEILASWIIVEDFQIKDAATSGVEIFEGDASKSLFFDNNTIRRVDFNGIGIGVTIKSSNNRVEESTFDGFVMVRNTPKDQNAEDDYGAIAINLNAATAFEKLGRTNITGNVITKNTVKNASAPSYDYEVDGGFVEIFDKVDNTTIAYNSVRDSEGFIEIGGNRHDQEVENLNIHHNISVDNRLFSFVNIGTYGIGIKNYQVFNNVIYEPTPGSRTAFWFDGTAAVNPTQFSLKNNILYLRATVTNKSTIGHENNIYNRVDRGSNQSAVTTSEIGYALHSSEKVTDAKFVDAANGNFRLQTGSPAINTGQSLGLSVDFAGVSIPQGTNVDIGAFEFGTPQTSPTTTPAASPSTCAEDINEDRVVNLLDYTLLSNAFLKTVTMPVRADINKDGKVDLLDFTLLRDKFLEKC